jgi:protein-S-isoprenylcysteine O-methyltransferase Ste14
MSERQTMKSSQRILRQIAQWVVLSVVIFVFITVLYLSLAASMGHSFQIPSFESLQTPAILTGIVLLIVGFVYALYSSGASKDGAWTIMTGPYVR